MNKYAKQIVIVDVKVFQACWISIKLNNQGKSFAFSQLCSGVMRAELYSASNLVTWWQYPDWNIIMFSFH